MRNYLFLGLLFITLSTNSKAVTTDKKESGNQTAGEKILKEATNKDKKNDPSSMELNPEKLEKTYAKDPAFSSESANQKEADKMLVNASEKNQERATNILLALKECQREASRELTTKCRQKVLKK
jgi:hypothetical protein